MSRFETGWLQVVPCGNPGPRISSGIRMVSSTIKPPLLQTPPFDPTASPWSAVKTTRVESARPARSTASTTARSAASTSATCSSARATIRRHPSVSRSSVRRQKSRYRWWWDGLPSSSNRRLRDNSTALGSNMSRQGAATTYGGCGPQGSTLTKKGSVPSDSSHSSTSRERKNASCASAGPSRRATPDS